MAAWQPPQSFRGRPVAVLGGGVLGRRIAACFVAGGWNVRIRDPSEAQRKAAVEYVETNIGSYTTLTQHEPAKVSAHEDLGEAVKDAWLVFEAVPEVLSIKTDTFRDLEHYAPPDCILGSNSSSYKTSEMLSKVRPDTAKRILNTHYMMPPATMVVELMTDGQTEQGIFPFLSDRLREAGLHPIVALKESTGFVFNRIWAAIKRETLKVLEEGVSTPEAIDGVFMEMYGAKQGPCRMMDNVGLDTVSHIETHYVTERHLDRVQLDWLDNNFVKAGKLGKKTPDKGGLFPAPQPGQSTRLIFLDIGTAAPLSDKLSAGELGRRGRVLSLDVSECANVATELFTQEAMPDGVAVYEDRIYWTEMGVPAANDGSIWSAKFDGTDKKCIIADGKIHTPKQLICVPEQKQLYWCDREGLRVMRSDLDGSNVKTLVQNGDFHSDIGDQTKWCVGVAVSTKLGKLFWTQKGPSKGSQGKILSANLQAPADPTARDDIIVILDHLPEPIDLELDDEAGVLYWTDRGELPLGNTLNKKTIVGQTPSAEAKIGRQILTQGLGEGIGLKLDKVNNCIFVTDLGGHIWKCDPHRPSLKKRVFESDTSAFTGLTIVRY